MANPAKSLWDDEALDGAILQAHQRQDGLKLAELYALAANRMQEQGELEAEGFLLTQAYVFALESGHADAEALRKRLITLGREQA